MIDRERLRHASRGELETLVENYSLRCDELLAALEKGRAFFEPGPVIQIDGKVLCCAVCQCLTLGGAKKDDAVVECACPKIERAVEQVIRDARFHLDSECGYASASMALQVWAAQR